jgi:hypothetical protein
MTPMTDTNERDRAMEEAAKIVPKLRGLAGKQSIQAYMRGDDTPKEKMLAWAAADIIETLLDAPTPDARKELEAAAAEMTRRSQQAKVSGEVTLAQDAYDSAARELRSRASRLPASTGSVTVSAACLLAVRDALVARDPDEAYHQLRMAANADLHNDTEHWIEWERASRTTPHPASDDGKEVDNT